MGEVWEVTGRGGGFTFAVRSSTSPGLNSSPRESSRPTMFGTPPASAATTGTPDAKDSRTTKPSVSDSDGITKTSAAAYLERRGEERGRRQTEEERASEEQEEGPKGERRQASERAGAGGGGARARELLPLEEAGEDRVRPRKRLAELLLRRPRAHHRESRVGDATEDLADEAHVLLGAEPPDVQQQRAARLAAAQHRAHLAVVLVELRVEDVGVDPLPPHIEVAHADALQLLLQLRRRAEAEIGPVEHRRQHHRGQPARQLVEHRPRHVAIGVDLQVGVVREHQRHAENARVEDRDDAEDAGRRRVDDRRLERLRARGGEASENCAELRRRIARRRIARAELRAARACSIRRPPKPKSTVSCTCLYSGRRKPGT